MHRCSRDPRQGPDPHSARSPRSRAAPARAATFAFTALFSLSGAWLESVAHAQTPAAAGKVDSSVEGTVLALDGDDLIVDLGSDRGLATGDTIELWRPIKLKHPVTGKVFSDRFRIGSLQVGQVRRSLSMAQPIGELSRPPERGDVVLFGRAMPPSSGEQPAPRGGDVTQPGAEPKAEDAETRAIGEMLEALRGADIATRIRRYEDHVRANPKGRFAQVLYEEAASLRKLYDGSRKPRSEAQEADEAPALRGFHAPSEVIAESPLHVAIELNDAATGALLHTRTKDQPSYTTTPMTTAGKGYFTATVPADRMVAPEIDLFIEATTPDGKAIAVLGQSDSPRSFEVRPVPHPKPPAKVAANVSISTDYADYNRMRGNDRVWQTEGEFGLRFQDTGVRALRSGFGVFRGVGGTLHELDDLDLAGREVGLTYGYLEGEFAGSADFSVITRLAIGLLDDGVSGGAQGLIRIGSDLKTNLVLGGEVLGGVGLRSIAELNLNTFNRYPILLRTEVTNQPAGASPTAAQAARTVSQGDGEIGARGIVQAGMRVTQPLTISVRGSFQGRNIKHAGPGFGAGVSYEW